MDLQIQTPICFMIFNRPHTTEHVFAKIAEARPSTLLVIADGPRPTHPDDAYKCAAARAVIERVDWPCDVVKHYAETNLGCGHRPATGLSWAFAQVEEAIILEDDCIPHPTFFRFCEELLAKFRDDERVMHIAGNNFQFRPLQTPYSYWFSAHNICWGWATWRRAWQYFDMGASLWPLLRETSWLRDLVEVPSAVAYWQAMFERAYTGAGEVDYWDYQWTFACWAQHGLSILPRTTLVSNIGFGDDATHTTGVHDPRAHLETTAMDFPLRHPPYVHRDTEADRHLIEHVVLPGLPPQPSLYRTLRRTCAAALPAPVRHSVSYVRSKWHH